MSRLLHFLPLVVPGREEVDTWTLPDYPVGHRELLERHVEIAHIAERAHLDGVLIADISFGDSPGYWKHRLPNDLEPLTFATHLAAHTERLGVVASLSTTFEEPFALARRLLSLDHLSAGRSGWNIITSYNPALARAYSATALPTGSERYARAAEVVDAVTGLWRALPSASRLADKSAGVFTDTSQIAVTDIHGEHVELRAILGSTASVQTHPVLFQAGASPEGRDLAARYAEAVFTFQRTLESARAFREEISARAAEAGRDSAPLVMPAVNWVIAPTEAEARRLHHEYSSKVPVRGVLQAQVGRLFTQASIDALDDPIDLDAPLPALAEEHGSLSRLVQARETLQQREVRTIRDYLALREAGEGVPYPTWIGTPEHIAQRLEDWFRAGAADGFVPTLLGDTNEQLARFADEVVPILVRRGLFRHRYEAWTLRGHLGLRGGE